MLLELSCSNHKSIKEKITFSALAGTDNTFEDELFHFGTYSVLRTSVIYGANGSGKSNFIDALSFIKNLVVLSINHQPGQGIKQTPHKLLSLKDKTTYDLQFIKSGIRYAFGFTLLESLVSEEYLYFFPKGRKVKIYERLGEAFYAGDKFSGRFESCKDVLKPNRLLISCAANFSSVYEIEQVYSFFRDDLVIYSGLGSDNWMDYSLRKIKEDEVTRRTVLSFLSSLGTGIKDIDIKIKTQNLPLSNLPNFLSDEFKATLLNNQYDFIEARVIYEPFSIDLLSEESTGIKKLFEFLCPFIDIIEKGKILICDELESNFHEAIVYSFVEFFRSISSQNSPQMIFTTHDTSLLDLGLFRRDQIWFTELRSDTRSTELYSLAEIKNVRRDENISKGYIAGKYGAIPMLNSNLAATITTLQSEVDSDGK